MLKGYIHSFESFGAVDGPGIRFIIFFKGCNFRCQYCHNADTWKIDGAEIFTADEILDKAERYRTYWRKNGGITASGGEPLLQIDFLTELFSKAHERKINTVLDTSAQTFSRGKSYLEKFNALMNFTDLILLDIKHINSEQHKILTGFDNKNILDAAKYLSEINKPVWIRHVLVPGITDDDKYLKQLREFLDTLKNIQRVDVLPYHTLGAEKWRKLGLEYPLSNVDVPDEERILNAKKILGDDTI